MKPELFLERLYELKRFLKEHPEQRIIYSDIPVDFLIMKTKKEIYEKENNENEIQNRQVYDDFIPATGVPFSQVLVLFHVP